MFMVSSAVELLFRKQVLNQHDAEIGEWCSVRLPNIGPTYIKIGQYMASRSDIFGKEFSAQLKTLNNAVPGQKCTCVIKKQCHHSERQASLIEINTSPIATAYRAGTQRNSETTEW
jgi:predicted unusual protein kinase regulating ubiquinone biosynthesis (AarF/ABC1/UbiB family)